MSGLQSIGAGFPEVWLQEVCARTIPGSDFEANLAKAGVDWREALGNYQGWPEAMRRRFVKRMMDMTYERCTRVLS